MVQFLETAPSEWNRLPHHIHALQSIDSFKAALKTYLFARDWILTAAETMWQSSTVWLPRALVTSSSCYGALEIVWLLLLLLLLLLNLFCADYWAIMYWNLVKIGSPVSEIHPGVCAPKCAKWKIGLQSDKSGKFHPYWVTAKWYLTCEPSACQLYTERGTKRAHACI